MLNIVIDTREQRPWSFPSDRVQTQRDTLHTGDYAIVGDGCFAIERKSLDDFLGTISSGWERFLREIGRMESPGCEPLRLIVEASVLDFCFTIDAEGNPIPPSHNHPMLSPAFVLKRIGQLSGMNVTPLFAVNRELAATVALEMLLDRSRRLHATEN